MKAIKYMIPLLLLLAAAVSCREKAPIPRDTLAEIYHDMYMMDRQLARDGRLHRMADSTQVYVSIFNRYGFTLDDYRKSVDCYMERPDKYVKILEKTEEMLEIRKNELRHLIMLEEERSIRWDFVDSLELYTADSVESSDCYRALRMLFFEADSTVPDSPVIDSSRLDRPGNPFEIFTDSTYDFIAWRAQGIKSYRLRMKEAEERKAEIEKEKMREDKKNKNVLLKTVTDEKGLSDIRSITR